MVMSFTKYLTEGLPESSPMQQKSEHAVHAALGKGKTNAMLKHKWMGDYHSYDKAYKHGVSRTQHHEVEVYPYMKEHHTTPEGRIRPTTMLRFHFKDTGHVAQVHKFVRDKEPSEHEKRHPGTGWKHVKSWKDEDK